MKTKRILILLSVIVALSMISSQVMAAPEVAAPKKTPPGLVKTPGVKATEKSVEKATKQADKFKGKKEHYKGVIAASDGSSIVLDLGGGSTLAFMITEQTRIQIPSVKGALSSGLLVGMKAMIQANRAEDDSLVALSIHVIPGKPSKVHRVGIVTAYTPDVSITIQAMDGQLYTFPIAPGAKILPADRAAMLVLGAKVTVIAPRDHATNGWTALGIVVHPDAIIPPTETPTPTATFTETPTELPTATPSETPIV